jgi:hypothetical protein
MTQVKAKPKTRGSLVQDGNLRRSLASNRDSMISVDDQGTCRHLRGIEGVSGMCEECTERAKAKEKMKECTIV